MSGDGVPEDEEWNRATAQNIIDTAEIYSPPNVFVLGPYARRVSFAAQQNRALNLVWALKVLGRIKENQNVAVVGGGLSGMMATASLLDMGCHVELYEEHAKLLWRQRNTLHRIVNPDINRWPDEPVGYSTELPFCDWYEEKCEKALDKVCRGWEEYVHGRMGPPHLNTPILKPLRVDDSKVALSTDLPIAEGPFDAVIVATGFSGEHTLNLDGTPDVTGTVPYWMGDGLEILTADISRKFVVSGCGDGGLLDVLRLVYPEFGYGKLAVDIASLIGQDSETATIIREGEDTAAKKRPAYAPGASDEDIRKADAQSVDQAAADLKAVYDRALARLDPAVKQRLKLIPQFEAVTLVCKEIFPFSRLAAPIHKLMVHHANANSKVRYQSGSLKDVGGEVQIWPRKGTEYDSTKPIVVTDKTIVRHGAPLAIEKRRDFLDSNALEDLKKRQDILSDRMNFPYWKGRDDGKGSHPDYKKTGPNNIERRKALLYDALREMTANYRISFSHPDKTFYVEYFGAVPKDNLPSSMFGSPVKPKPMAEWSAL